MRFSIHAPDFTEITMNKKRHKPITNTKSQLKIGESIFVLLIFFILLCIGLIFYAKVQSHISEQDAKEYNAKRAIDMALSVKFMPELQCTVQATEEFDCIDLLKLKAFAEMVNDPDKDSYRRYYATVYPNARLYIKQVYAPSSEILSDNLVLFENIYSSEKEAKGVDIISLPVTIYDPVSDSNTLGFIVLESYLI
jgi:hypothetical protein